MKELISYDKERYKMIEDLRNSAEKQAKEKRESLPQAKLELHGTSELYKIYRLPINKLLYNKLNGRIKAEVMAKEEELGSELHPSNSENASIIREILLSIEKQNNTLLENDLKEKGQMQPGIITCDGVVINGNRRKAIFETLDSPKYQFLDVHILPSSVTKKDIWLIETGIQMSSKQQLDYGPVNQLLKWREGVEAGITPKQMASTIYGLEEKDIKKSLDRLELIEEYLKFIGKEREYQLITKKSEHFIDLQDNLNVLKQKRGRSQPDWEVTDKDLNELKAVTFYYIRAGFAHQRIRDFKHLFRTEKSWGEASKALTVPIDIPDKDIVLVETDLNEDDLDLDDELESSEEGLKTAVTERIKQEEELWKRENTPQLKSCFQDAKEQLSIEKAKEKPEKLLNSALRNLKGIDLNNEDFYKPEIDKILAKIIKKVNELRKIHGKRKK